MNGRLANARAITIQTTFMQYLTLCFTRFRHRFCAVLNCISQLSGSNEWRHIRQVSGASGPRQPCEIWWSSLKQFSRNSTRSRLKRHFRLSFRSSFRPEAGSDVISGSNVGLVGLVAPVKFGDSSSNSSRDIQQRSRRVRQFRQFLNVDNCRPEVVSDVISGMVDQDVGMDECANFGDSRLKPSEASFSAVFRTPITSDRKYIVTSYPVWL